MVLKDEGFFIMGLKSFPRRKILFFEEEEPSTTIPWMCNPNGNEALNL
jgi:hypothetical protein